MTYKSVIDLIPQDMNQAGHLRIASRSRETFGTTAYSLDDAFGMVSGGNDDSYIRVWHYNLFNGSDQARLMESEHSLRFMAINSYAPYVWDIAWDLARVGDGYDIRSLDKIRTATIHHTVGWDESATNFENAENIASYHVNTKQWPGIAYHFLIAPDGEIMQTNNLEAHSFHAGSFNAPGDENEWSMGICLAGDFRNGRAPTQFQLSCASSLIAELRRALPRHINVIPHKHMPGAQTICPGDYPDSWLKVLDGYL